MYSPFASVSRYFYTGIKLNQQDTSSVRGISGLYWGVMGSKSCVYLGSNPVQLCNCIGKGGRASALLVGFMSSPLHLQLKSKELVL